MFKKILTLSLTFWWASYLFATPSHMSLSKPFHNILVRGDLDVRLHHTQGPTHALAYGDSQDLIYLEFHVQDDWLKVHVGRGFPHYGKMSVDIWVNDLHRLVQRDSAKVVGHQLRSSGLIISTIGTAPLILDGKISLTGLQARKKAHVEIAGVQTQSLSVDLHEHAYVKLQGTMGLCDIHVYDKSWLSMYWVKANRLNMTYGGRSFVQMAGRVNVLDVELYQHAKFAGRYLRATRAFVRTHDYSSAQISVELAQHTLALEESHIDYYDVPFYRTDFMADDGAVLDLREWTMPYAQVEQRYED